MLVKGAPCVLFSWLMSQLCWVHVVVRGTKYSQTNQYQMTPSFTYTVMYLKFRGQHKKHLRVKLVCWQQFSCMSSDCLGVMVPVKTYLPLLDAIYHQWRPELGSSLCLQGPFQNLIWCLIVRSHKVSKPWDLYLELYDRFEIWQAPWQQCCQCAYQITKQCGDMNYQSCGSETSWNLTIRHLIGYWNRAQMSSVRIVLITGVCRQVFLKYHV